MELIRPSTGASDVVLGRNSPDIAIAGGDNPSGLIPLDTRVVLLLDPVETKVGSIILPDQETDKRKFAQTKATVIALGDNAFADWGGTASKPQVGGRVIAGRYVGNQHKGADGREYTVCNDEDILALWGGE